MGKKMEEEGQLYVPIDKVAQAGDEVTRVTRSVDR